MIYGRTGEPCTIVRLATLSDVELLELRKPDKQDRLAVECGAYVVVRFHDGKGSPERIYHQAFLRADGGSREISERIAGLES